MVVVVENCRHREEKVWEMVEEEEERV